MFLWDMLTFSLFITTSTYHFNKYKNYLKFDVKGTIWFNGTVEQSYQIENQTYRLEKICHACLFSLFVDSTIESSYSEISNVTHNYFRIIFFQY